MPHQSLARDAFIELVDAHRHLVGRADRNAFLTDDLLRPLVGKLWNCTDIMPGDLCEAIGVHRGATYAQGVRALRTAVAA